MSVERLASRRRRARFEEVADEDNSHRWVLSYADFITLLFAFFVVMYSISSVNDGKFRVLSDSMETSFRRPQPMPAPIDLGGGLPGVGRVAGADDETGQPTRPFEEVAQDDFPVPVTDIDAHDVTAGTIEKILKDPVELDQVRIRQSEEWIEVELDGSFAFDSGAARLTQAADPTLSRLAALIKQTTTPVRVEGFTDDRPAGRGLYASNFELSAARAGSVAAALVARGVDADRLSAAGYGENHPVADNTSEDGRRRNRRVVIAIARHPQVPGASVSLAARGDGPEQLSLDSLKRVSVLPGPEEIGQ
ncbi:MAG: OmpA family protein [Gammaproteobacteria bacterium]|nr:OmpA family protein [Gammaproteobacteria bacterium]